MNNNHASDTMNQGRISSVPLLDFRHVKSADELEHITAISSVGAILISEDFQGIITKFKLNSVGGIVTVPKNAKLKIITGSLKLTGEFLENTDGDPDEILLLVGELMITTPFKKVGFKSIIATGEFLIPKGSEGVFGTSVSQLTGEVFYYNHVNARIFSGQDRFGKDFFSYMKQPLSMILKGDFIIEADVTPELLQEKVSEIVLMGNLQAEDKKLVPLLLALTSEKRGEIKAVNG
jgi:hypothetical protein